MVDEDDRILVSVKEAARLLDVNEITIRRLIQRGELSAMKVGRALRVHRPSLEAWVKAQLEGEDNA